MAFQTTKSNEQTGLVIYRNAESYYLLLKDRSDLVLIKKDHGKRDVVASVPYKGTTVYLKAVGNHGNVEFTFGPSLNQMIMIGQVQSLKVIGKQRKQI